MWLEKGLIAIIQLYQKLAPEKVRSRCRFEPSCSNYAAMAIEKYGAWKGLHMTVQRLGRCRPPHGGEDYP